MTGLSRIRPVPLFADAFDEEGDPHVRAPLVEVVAAESRRNDVHGLDVPERRAGLGQRLLHGVVGALARGADQLDDLDCGQILLLSVCTAGPERCSISTGAPPLLASHRAGA